MHSFVKLKKERTATPEEAIAEVQNELNSNRFAGDSGFFGESKCDWYVVGGRWSGQLQQAHLGIDFYAEVKKSMPAAQSASQSDARAQDLWEELGGKGNIPFGRDQYAQSGATDDAAPLTAEMLKSFRKNEYYRDVEVLMPTSKTNSMSNICPMRL
jgi:hypothetical protein